ncbi:MAG: type IV pilus assembly protein PilM [Verrucomicrobia bacterium]|nr:type IV pilus assembly protein PilM [Verrucomicrobiota bacterium]
MLKSKSFLCADFGAGTLKVAEFEATPEGGLRLLRFGVRSLGIEGSQEAARERVLLKGLQDLIAERGFASKQVNACAPGFHVFSKFVKLPPVDSSKVTQIIQYEAQQNVPFPLNEVVWDYQILGNTASGELEVLLVAIKSDLVETMYRAAEGAGLRIHLVDASPAALANAFKFNYGDVEGCSMLLDIGAKTSNVLFFEKGKVFSRGINIGANSITQDFMAEAKMRFADAELFKINEGFVGLGGAYEDPENPKQAAISKVARQVLTRLHIQVNQTIQFYRTQQGGSPPQRVFICGGASVMRYAMEFFQEKLNLPIEYFNPFRSVTLSDTVEVLELEKVAHTFSEVVGLGLRNLAQCPVELNLIPKHLLKRQELSQKKPYFIATALCLILVVFAGGFYYSKVTEVQDRATEKLSGYAVPLNEKKERLEKEEAKIANAKKELEVLGELVQERLTWPEMLVALRKVMLETEEATRRKLGVETGLWFESFTPELPAEDPNAGSGESSTEGSSPMRYMMDPRMMARYGLIMRPPAGGDPAADPAATGDPAADGGEKKSGNTNEVKIINAVCRGVNNMRIRSSANTELAFDFQHQLQNHELLKPFLEGTNGTKLSKELGVVTETEPTFSFGVVLKLKKPIKL